GDGRDEEGLHGGRLLPRLLAGSLRRGSKALARLYAAALLTTSWSVASAEEIPDGGVVSPSQTTPPPDGATPTGSSRTYGSTVRGGGSGPGRTSTEAVELVDTKVARQETATLGAVLDSTKGVVLRQSAGLGSPTTFYLQGLSGNRIRFFVDGVPVDSS